MLLERPWLCPAVLACMVGLAPLVGRWLLDRPAVTWGLAGLSLVPLALLTLTPVGVLTNRTCTLQWALPTIGRVELLANVVLFVAPVFLTALGLRRPLTALLAGSALSVALEAAQAFLPGRACDTNDWLNNTIGAVIGAALAFAVLRAADRAGGAPAVRPGRVKGATPMAGLLP